jgi:hypothetical protein
MATPGHIVAFARLMFAQQARDQIRHCDPSFHRQIRPIRIRALGVKQIHLGDIQLSVPMALASLAHPRFSDFEGRTRVLRRKSVQVMTVMATPRSWRHATRLARPPTRSGLSVAQPRPAPPNKPPGRTSNSAVQGSDQKLIHQGCNGKSPPAVDQQTGGHAPAAQTMDAIDIKLGVLR